MSSLLESSALGVLRGVASVSARTLGSRRVLILVMHRVLPEADPFAPFALHAGSFRSLMQVLVRVFQPISLAQVVSELHRGTLPERSVCVTFDDGYADNAEVAMPILQALGIPATFFIATGFLNGGVMFNDLVTHAVRHAAGERIELDTLGLGCHDVSTPHRRCQAAVAVLEGIKARSLDERGSLTSDLLTVLDATAPMSLMMSDEQVKDLVRAGMSVGGHTHNHPVLRAMSPKEAHEEVIRGKHYLEDLIQDEVTLFAYPNGRPGIDYDASHVELLRRCGFEAAVSTAWGVASPESSLMELPRFMPWERSPARFAARVTRALVSGRVP